MTTATATTTTIDVYESLTTEHDRLNYMARCVISMDHEIFLGVIGGYAPKTDVELLTLYCQRHHRMKGEPFVVER